MRQDLLKEKALGVSLRTLQRAVRPFRHAMKAEALALGQVAQVLKGPVRRPVGREDHLVDALAASVTGRDDTRRMRLPKA